MSARGLGIVHLGDLAVGYPWSKPRLPALLETLGWPLDDDAPSERRLDPPPTLAVVLSYGGEALVARHHAWLRRAKRIVLVRELVGQDELLADPELIHLLDQEHATVEASLGGDVRSVK
jgi:hypothetical protein